MVEITDIAGVRKCAGCQEPVAPDEGLRWFLAPDGQLWPDWTGRSARLGGRGATTHARAECVASAHKEGRLKRALKQGYARVELDVLLGRAVERGESAYFERLGLALRAGQLWVGDVAIREGFKTDGQALLLVAANSGAANRQRAVQNATRKECPIVVIATGEELGRPLGREFVSVALVRESAFGRTLVAWSRGLCWLGAPSVVRCPEVLDDSPTGAFPGFVRA